ncbi:MAG: DUF2267 domain-containing protein [Chloroflexota bacterium]|jgi:uncharacterized protein (DUF2267 family)
MDLESYYQFVCSAGELRTPQHARRWTDGVLRTLGIALDRKTKNALTKELPDELARSVGDVFWLLHFRDPNLSLDEFLQRAARRSGNSNSEFAMLPTRAVFAGLRFFISPEVDQQVARTLSPELCDFWEQAGTIVEKSERAA